MDEDPEALVDRRLAGDPEDARELVLQRAGPVGLDVRRPRASARRRGAGGTTRATARCAPPPPARAGARRARRRAGTRRAPSVSKISRCSAVDGLQQPRVDLGQRVGDRLRAARAGALEQRGELDQLEVAHDGVGDVEVGVEAQLAEPPADLRDRRRAARRAAAGTSTAASRRAEQLLALVLPLAADRRARLLGERRRPSAPRRARCSRGTRARAGAARASSPCAAAAASRRCGRPWCRPAAPP